jgi:hypothetical protein
METKIPNLSALSMHGAPSDPVDAGDGFQPKKRNLPPNDPPKGPGRGNGGKRPAGQFNANGPFGTEKYEKYHEMERRVGFAIQYIDALSTAIGAGSDISVEMENAIRRMVLLYREVYTSFLSTNPNVTVRLGPGTSITRFEVVSRSLSLRNGLNDLMDALEFSVDGLHRAINTQSHVTDTDENVSFLDDMHSGITALVTYVVLNQGSARDAPKALDDMLERKNKNVQPPGPGSSGGGPSGAGPSEAGAS